MTEHVNRSRHALADVRYYLRLARDAGEVPVDVARILLASLADTDNTLARYEDDR